MIQPKFEIGQKVYSPSSLGIISGVVQSIIIGKDMVQYVFGGNTFAEAFVYASYGEAVDMMIEEEKDRYEKAVAYWTDKKNNYDGD